MNVSTQTESQMYELKETFGFNASDKDWRYQRATGKQLDLAWEQPHIRQAFEKDLTAGMPLPFVNINLHGLTSFHQYGEPSGRGKHIAAGVCHWTVRGNLLTAQFLWPKIEWMAWSSHPSNGQDCHSTVVSWERGLIYDPYFEFIKFPAQEGLELAMADSVGGSGVSLATSDPDELIGLAGPCPDYDLIKTAWAGKTER